MNLYEFGASISSSVAPCSLAQAIAFVSGVPPASDCEKRAEAALQAAKATNLANVQKLYARSALRWSELANLKTGLS